MKKILKIAGLTLLLLVVAYYLSLVVVFNVNLYQDNKSQATRLEELKQQAAEAFDENDFADFDINSSSLKLNEIQFLATHNSFKAMPNMYFNKLLELFWGQKVRDGQYGMPYLYDQLSSGIRGVEIDIVKYGDDFIVIHDPVTDWRTNVPDFRLALEEIKLWSDNHPGHIPINIMLQVRNSKSIFNAKFKTFSHEDAVLLNDIIEEVFTKDGIIKPSDIIGEHNNLRLAVENDGWPLVTDCLNKVFFSILFDQKQNEQMYVDIDTTMMTQNAFIFARANDVKDYTAMIVADSPFDELNNDLIARNFILRTRIDVQFSNPIERLEAAIALGSTILTTDYPIGHSYKDDYIAKLTPDNKTIIARDID